MRFLRTLSTRSLLFVLTAVVAVAIGGAALAVAAGGGKSDTPPPASLADAIHSALTASKPAGITAKVTFTNNLFPSGALLGQQGSALMSGASGRLWATNDGRGRIELQSDAGDVQIVWNQTDVSVYDASSNTVYKATLPASSTTQTDTGTPPTVTQISDFLTKLAAHWDINGPTATNVATQPAYRVSLSPRHDGGLLGSAQLAWDAVQGVPLSVAVYAQGSSTPVLELKATEISYGAVASSDVDVSPPAGAKVVDLSSSSSSTDSKNGGTPVTGVAAVSAAAGFQVVAPDTLVGLPRQDVRLIGGTGSKGALVVYGQGLGAIVVAEHKADASSSGGPLAALPKISLDGATGHELATALGTVVEWQRNGISYVLAGSLPSAAAETAARALK